jgi:hypothetical protein
MCPGVDSDSKNEYKVNPGGKDRPVRKADNLPTSCADVKKSGGALTSWKPVGLFRPVMGELYMIIGYKYMMLRH